CVYDTRPQYEIASHISLSGCVSHPEPTLWPTFSLALLQRRECREMRIHWFTPSEAGDPAKRRTSGRHCHRKHVEDG
ncbi:unnamed protein product, partial [Sphenostylis stenocarpa]